MAELTDWPAGQQLASARKVTTDMHSVDAVVSDLEWQRLRRRVAGNSAEALLRNCATWVLIVFLKLVSR